MNHYPHYKNEMPKQLIDNVTPLTVQSAARMQIQELRRTRGKNKLDIEQWRTDEAARKRQRRFAGLKQEATPVKEDYTTRTVHPSKLKAAMDKQRRVNGMKHQAPRLLLAKDLLYRTTHPKKLDALRLGQTKSTVCKRPNNLGKLFRSVSEGSMIWGCPHRWTGTSGGFRVVSLSA
jgi:hypothetical protein